nr:MAG TPA: hypothetical protein [Caudoviricetes sp.]
MDFLLTFFDMYGIMLLIIGCIVIIICLLSLKGEIKNGNQAGR